MTRLERCTFDGCGATILASAMPDHWIIAYHYSPLLPARSVRFEQPPEVLPANTSVRVLTSAPDVLNGWRPEVASGGRWAS